MKSSSSKKSPRKSYGSTIIKGISPQRNNPKNIEKVNDLNTIGFVLTKPQACEIINLLNTAILDGDSNLINLTGFRKSNQVTITSYIPVSQRRVN